MNVKITAKGFDLTDAIEEVIHKKLQRMEKLLTENANVTWVCKKNGPNMDSEIKITDKGHEYYTHTSDKNLYHTFDLGVDKLKDQINRQNKH